MHWQGFFDTVISGSALLQTSLQIFQLTQMHVNALGVEFSQTVSKFIKRKKIISYILHKTSN